MCDCESPRQWNNLGTFLTWQRNYRSPDENDFSSPCEFEMDMMERYKKSDYIVLPVYKYEHGEISYNTSGATCPWDSGQCGYIYATKDDIRNWFNVKRITKETLDKAYKILEIEVDNYSSWANGECCEYIEEEYVA